MDRIHELIEVLGDKAVISRGLAAKEEKICKICGKPAKHFRTTFSEFEFSLSSICQSCQDYYFMIEN
ncbi:MAG: hypothetical protein PVJ84_06415 [Desulfobacteraceae bacterium]